MRRVNITVRGMYQSRLLASSTITGVSQADAKRFIAQSLSSIAVATSTMDNELCGRTMFRVDVEIHDYERI